MTYVGTDQWWEDISAAKTKFRVIAEQTEARGDCSFHRTAPVGPCRYVEVEAGTGSRYLVVVTRLGSVQDLVGAPLLVSVIEPWQAVYPMQPAGLLHWTYVGEKFLTRPMERVHAGDVVALTMTIAHALGRSFELPERGEG